MAFPDYIDNTPSVVLVNFCHFVHRINLNRYSCDFMYRQANSNLTRFGIFQAETEANVIVSVLYVYAPSRTRPDSFCGHACSQRVVEVN